MEIFKEAIKVFVFSGKNELEFRLAPSSVCVYIRARKFDEQERKYNDSPFNLELLMWFINGSSMDNIIFNEHIIVRLSLICGMEEWEIRKRLAEYMEEYLFRYCSINLSAKFNDEIK